MTNGINHRRLQNLMFLFCVLFGLAMIADTQTAADGVWFWYAAFLHGGQRLYSGMHLALPPLFALEASFFLGLFGKGWLVSKIPAALHLIAYCFAFLLLVRRSKLSDAQKALVLGCAFFVSISFEAYRFDDYHVLADCFQLYSLVTLLALQNAPSARRILVLASVLGVLAGLALTTRLNDGAALASGVVLGILCLAPSKKLLSITLFCLAAALTALLIVRLTGDSFHDYAMYTIFKAAGSKGGAGSVLTYPLMLPINTIRWLAAYWLNLMLLCSTAVALIWGLMVRPQLRQRPQRRHLAVAALGVFLLALLLWQLYFASRNILLDILLLASLSAFAVILAYGLGVWVFARFLSSSLKPTHISTWDRREILLLIPLGQLASGSMSSGGSHIGLYAPLGILIVVLSICSPIHLRARWLRDSLAALALLLSLTTLSFKIRRPFSWHTYVEKPLFVDRTWYRHPDYGPMILDRDLLQLIEPVCQTIKNEGSSNELLSLPFPYANYFCNIPPWHGYVQTFFDTTSKQTIDSLIDELQSSPPTWIFYQRQLYTLQLHERIYNRGKPLEHRYLDQFIEQKISQGTWQVVYTSDYGNTQPWDNHWLLIRTH
jgi:hypothetical protein